MNKTMRYITVLTLEKEIKLHDTFEDLCHYLDVMDLMEIIGFINLEDVMYKGNQKEFTVLDSVLIIKCV